jgi:hypothetical protein
MQNRKDEILLPPGVKSLNDLSTIKVKYNNVETITKSNNEQIINNGKGNSIGSVTSRIVDNNVNNENNIPGILLNHKESIDKESSLTIENSNNKNNNSNSNSNNSIDDYFEDISIINEERPKNIKPYVRKRNKRDVLKIISKKVVPNEQLLKDPIITTLTTNENNIDLNHLEDDNNDNKKQLFSPQNLRYLNANGTVSNSQEENIRNKIKNIHNSTGKSSIYIYNHKDFPARRIKQSSFLFHRVGAGISDEKAQQSLQTHKRKMEGVQNAIIKKIKQSRNL